MNQEEPEYHDFVIIGSGISGLHAGMILSQYEKDFVILQASSVIGGRIGTQFLGDVINKQMSNNQSVIPVNMPNWIQSNPSVLRVPIEYGATWIGTNHQYMKNLCKQLKIKIFPQFKQGHTVYGIQNERYTDFEKLYNQQTREKIGNVLHKIQKLRNQYLQLYEQAIQKQYPDKKKVYHELVKKYDSISVKSFIQNQINDFVLSGQIMSFIECLQCIDCGKFSMMQLLDDDDSLAIVYEVIGDIDEDDQEADDGYRVQSGMITVVNRMVDRIIQQSAEQGQDKGVVFQSIFKLNSPVVKINSWSKGQKSCLVTVNEINGFKQYSCKRVLNGIPLATLSKVMITNLPVGKQIIFNGQQMGVVYRTYMVMKAPFWRDRFNGYGSFSPNFPFNEMTDISPAGNQCGILAFASYVDKYQKWVANMPNAFARFEMLRKVIADMFLNGNTGSPMLEGCFMYTRTFSDHQYIGAAYQPTTKMGVWLAVEESGDQYGLSLQSDENGIHYIGSDISEEFGSYMEGSLRITRKKVHQLISKSDPWKK